MTSHYRLSWPAPSELHIALDGDLEEPTVLALEKELSESFAQQRADELNVVYELQGLSDSSVTAKNTLARVHRMVAARVHRSAFVDERPRFRGFGLFVLHMSGDTQGKAVSSLEAARAWLSRTETRTEAARALLGGAR